MGEVINLGKTEFGWTFGLKVTIIMCDDAPCAVCDLSDKARKALAWAKEHLDIVDNDVDFEKKMYLIHIPNDEDAVYFRLMWG